MLILPYFSPAIIGTSIILFHLHVQLIMYVLYVKVRATNYMASSHCKFLLTLSLRFDY